MADRRERAADRRGQTCDDPDYAAWVARLRDQGFEIAFHHAAYSTSDRAQALRGLERFRELFGGYPTAHANHADNRDGIYWGPSRVSGVHRLAYTLLTRGRTQGQDSGSDPESGSFWADACRERVTYVLNFVFRDINTLRQVPFMPNHDPARPYVNQWFASSEGPDRRSFCRTIGDEHQDRLEAEGGACIMYTHFGAADFMEDGRLHPDFVRLMTRLAAKGGWFVPVSTLLDHIRRQRGEHVITASERNRLERRWLFEKVFVTRGTT